MFQFYDEDFSEIFKVKADFSSELDGISQPELLISRFVRKLKDTHALLPFDPGAIAELCIISTRMAGEKGKLTSEMSKLSDLISESSFWAKKENASIVSTTTCAKSN